MAIEKLNSNSPVNERIQDLNDMILEINGKNAQGKFDKNEIDQIFTDLGIDRQFVRNYSIGHTTGTYTGWTHLHAESGYSIWKYTISDYQYDALNQLYFDDKVLEFRGSAGSESATSFDLVYLYDEEVNESGYTESTYTNDTAEAATEEGTEFELMNESDDYLYLGDSSTFSGAKFEFYTRGSNYTLKVEYYNGAWTELTANDDNLVDNTNDFASNGYISWDVPDDWSTCAVNSQTYYWIRISTTTEPVTTAEAYYIIPYNSVIGLLAMSSTQILAEEWCWCSYGTSIYVTIRNTGGTTYEGDYYITSSSSSTNKQNFFIYNHEYKIDYEDSTYVAGTSAFTQGVSITSPAETTPVLTLSTNASYSGSGDDPIQYTYQVVGQTTGATASAIANWTLATDTVYIFHAIVVARRTGGSGGTAGDGAGYVVTAVYKRTSSGAATIIGSADADVTCENVSGWDCTYTANGNDVQLLVTGAANTNITWHATVTVQKVQD